MKVALIAAGASVLTSAIHGATQAIFEFSYPLGLTIGYVIGRVIGDVPAAAICFGVVYACLRPGATKEI